MNRRTALIALGAGGFLAAFRDLYADDGADVSPETEIEGLRARADRKGLLMGAAVYGKRLREDARIGPLLRANANIIVPEVELKWSVVEPAQDRFAFEEAEALYAFASQNNMKMRGHTLTWYRSIPDWARAVIPTLTPAAAGDMLEKYVSTVVGHFKGRLPHWDVANEPIDGHRVLSEPLWSAKLGEQYIDIAFNAAHAADPAALLVLNTNLIEMNESYQDENRTAALELLERLLKRGVPVHALGIESHLMGSFSESVYRAFLDRVTGMGLKIIVTEFDIVDHGILPDIASRDASVAALGKAFLDVNFSYPQCLGMLTWSMFDHYSWLRTETSLQRFDGAPLRPGLFDDDFKRKPLFDAIAAALDGAPARSL